jgi:hypothetical protein
MLGHGTKLKPSPLSIMVKLPLASCAEPRGFHGAPGPLRRGRNRGPLGRELAADALDLLTLERPNEVGSPAVRECSRGMAASDQLVRAPLESLAHACAESALREGPSSRPTS